MIVKSFIFNDLHSDVKLFTFVNPYSYYCLKNSDVDLKNFNIYSDGILFVKLYNLFHKKKIQRYSFDYTSLAPIIFNYSISKSMKVAIVGGSEDEIIKAKNVIEKKHLGIDIVFYHHGFCENIDVLINKMKSKDVNVVIAGLGTPLQEQFILSCSESIPTLKVAFTCGGFLTQMANNENYFHPLFDRFHLRWLQRFCRHSYVRKRMLINYPLFIFNYLKENLKG